MSHISFRVSERLAAQIEEQASAAGLTASAFLRRLAEESVSADEDDAELVRRLSDGDPTAKADLMSLNIVSLVHRVCLGECDAYNLLLRYTEEASDAQKDRAIASLIAAVRGFAFAAPDIEEMNERVSRHLVTLARRRRAA